MDLEDRIKTAVARAYRAAGVQLNDKHAGSLARVYADWAQGADDGVVERIERALATSLGVSVA